SVAFVANQVLAQHTHSHSSWPSHAMQMLNLDPLGRFVVALLRENNENLRKAIEK
ncbi:unnamed protein product, partial [Ceratitis capitata]